MAENSAMKIFVAVWLTLYAGSIMIFSGMNSTHLFDPIGEKRNCYRSLSFSEFKLLKKKSRYMPANKFKWQIAFQKQIRSKNFSPVWFPAMPAYLSPVEWCNVISSCFCEIYRIRSSRESQVCYKREKFTITHTLVCVKKCVW